MQQSHDASADRPVAVVGNTPARHQAAQPSHGRARCLLVVDDSIFVRQRLVELIVEDLPDFHVVPASNGHEANQLFAQLRPSVVMLDIHLPDVNGMDLLKSFKAKDPDCVLLVLTAYAFPELREKCLGMGAAHFFDKATEFERVGEVLRDLQVAN